MTSEQWEPPRIFFNVPQDFPRPSLFQILNYNLDLLAKRVGRSCGECQACCEIHIVRRLPECDTTDYEEKPAGTRCRHQCGNGCAVYPDRPTNCALYFCWWRFGWGEETDRPDILACAFDAAVGSSGRWADLPVVVARESKPGILVGATGDDRSRRDGRVGSAIAHWEQRNYVVLFHYWGASSATGGVASPAARELMRHRGILD